MSFRSELFSLLVPTKVAVNIALHLPGLGSKRRLESESKAGRLEPSPARRLEPREAGARATGGRGGSINGWWRGGRWWPGGAGPAAAAHLSCHVLLRGLLH